MCQSGDAADALANLGALLREMERPAEAEEAPRGWFFRRSSKRADPKSFEAAMKGSILKNPSVLDRPPEPPTPPPSDEPTAAEVMRAERSLDTLEKIAGRLPLKPRAPRGDDWVPNQGRPNEEPPPPSFVSGERCPETTEADDDVEPAAPPEAKEIPRGPFSGQPVGGGAPPDPEKAAATRAAIAALDRSLGPAPGATRLPRPA